MLRPAFIIALAACCLAPLAVAAQGLGPAFTTAGDWTIRRSKDAMTDKVRCTGVYLDRPEVQLGSETLYLVLRGRGGVKAYTLRIDDRPAGEMQIPSKSEKELGAIAIRGPVFRDLLGAKRLRAKILTVLNSSVVEDISLVGVQEALAVITGPDCR